MSPKIVVSFEFDDPSEANEVIALLDLIQNGGKKDYPIARISGTLRSAVFNLMETLALSFDGMVGADPDSVDLNAILADDLIAYGKQLQEAIKRWGASRND